MPKQIIDHKWELGTFYLVCINGRLQRCYQGIYAVHSGRYFQIQKKDNIRARVVCQVGSEWMAFCAKLSP